LTALRNIEFASFLRWYVAVELHDPAYAKRFYCTHEILEENMIKVWDHKLSFSECNIYSGQNKYHMVIIFIIRICRVIPYLYLLDKVQVNLSLSIQNL
jgi:hypothetical protein